MVEKLLEDDPLFDSPFLRRLREEGLLAGRRRSIVDVLTLRFAPPAPVVKQVEQYVETLTDEAALERLLAAAARSASLTEFQAAMAQG